jgi:hypothetical protein
MEGLLIPPPPARGKATKTLAASAVSSETDNAMPVDLGDATEGEPAPEKAPAEEPVPTKPLYSYKDYTPEPIRVYTQSVYEVNDHLPLLRGPLGFDMEWKVLFHRKATSRATAVVQICDERYIWVIQVSVMRRCESLFGVQYPIPKLNPGLGFPFALREILENPDVPKIGVSIRSGYLFCCPISSVNEIHVWLTDDAKKLYKDFGVKMQNLVELSYMSRQADKDRRLGGKLHARKLISLQSLVGGYLSKHLLKSDARLSDWEVRLSDEQLECECLLELELEPNLTRLFIRCRE